MSSKSPTNGSSPEKKTKGKQSKSASNAPAPKKQPEESIEAPLMKNGDQTTKTVNKK